MVGTSTATRSGKISHSMTSLAVVATLLLSGSEAAGYGDIKVDAEQKVTVQGEFRSLQRLVEELCWQAGVKIYSYDALDRDVAVRYDGVPLYKVLRRLLREDSHTLGFRRAPDIDTPQVAWLRVMGDNKQARMNQSLVGNLAKPQPFNVPSDLLNAAFAAETDDERKLAQTTLTKRITSDPEQLRQFLEITPRDIADAVRRYPGSTETMKGIRDGIQLADLRQKLDEVIDELE